MEKIGEHLKIIRDQITKTYIRIIETATQSEPSKSSQKNYLKNIWHYFYNDR